MKPTVIAPVLSAEECSRKCLLSPACDMFDFSSTTCKFYPFIKLKGRIASQVHKEFSTKLTLRGFCIVKVTNFPNSIGFLISS